MAKQQSTAARQIIFEGVIVRGASVSNGDSRKAKVEFTASWTEGIREEMEWEELPDCCGATDLIGSLSISEAALTPEAPISKSGDMKQHREEFPADELGGFNVVPLKDKSGEVTGHELRFHLETRQLNVPGIIGRYIHKLGRAPGTLLVTVSEDGEQQTLDS